MAEEPIDPETTFQSIEAALVEVARKHYGDESHIIVSVNRHDASLSATCNGLPLDPEEMLDRVGRSTAMQAIVRKLRETS